MGVVDTILRTGQQIIGMLLAEAVAAMIAKEAHKGLIGLATAAIGVGALMGMWAKYKSKAAEAAKMAGGGTVPPGYPNDTYPALLSSGEKVIPPGKLERQTVQVSLNGEWELDGRKLKYVTARGGEFIDAVT